MSEDIITINAIIQKKSGLTQELKPIQVRVFCKYQYAVATFSDKKLAKKLYKKDKSQGKDVMYDEKTKAFIQRFKNKSAKEVCEIIGKELKATGGTIQ